ncbi:V-set and immunoglobulin domain-containing protein 1-like [Brachionichthys hirsutus]|uniref:V-set and immunoglobulin domain-containing protein 1-like n=1 Tax=Brachionichthys hirsutus TaxID=412623 RepID=UPI003604BB06
MCITLRLFVLISAIGFVELITVKTPEKNVNVTTGGSILLQCTFVTIEQTNGLAIQWNFVSLSSLKREQVYYYQSGIVVLGKLFKDRLHLPASPATTRNASITISDMQTSDAGVYTCEVHNIPDVEGQFEASVVVSVLEKPSSPYCAIHGDVESGHLVTLTCHSERGSPPPTYSWTNLDQAKTRRPAMGRTTKTGILEIRNISEFQFGEYQCNATNIVGFSLCTVELNAEVGHGVIAGAVIGALLGCVLIVLVAWFIVHTVKKHAYKPVKAGEATEMKASSSKKEEATENVPMAAPRSSMPEGEAPEV